jgi:hypothetical protein
LNLEQLFIEEIGDALDVALVFIALEEKLVIKNGDFEGFLHDQALPGPAIMKRGAQPVKVFG